MISIGLGLLLAAGINGVATIFGGAMNASENAANRRQAKEIDDRNFAWNQEVDRFNMGMQNRQQAETEKMNRHQITKDNLSKLQDVLNNDVALRDKTLALWGVK